MPQMEESRRPNPSPTFWPEPWPGSPQAPIPPVWCYPPPPVWYTPPTLEEPPAQGGAVARLTYSVEEAAEAIGVSRATMYDLIHREDFPTLKIGNRRLIFREGLAEWVRRQAGG